MTVMNVLARKVGPSLLPAEQQCDDREGADDAGQRQRQEYPMPLRKRFMIEE